jgi:hypothetical protein
VHDGRYRSRLAGSFGGTLRGPLPFISRPPGVVEALLEFGEDWRDLLERACFRISGGLQVDGASFRFAQLKEKYGTLRAYWGGALSSETGRAGRGNHRPSGGPLQGELVPVRPGYDLHIVRQIVDGSIRIEPCRRYDREAAAFVDVDPGSLGIEE